MTTNKLETVSDTTLLNVMIGLVSTALGIGLYGYWRSLNRGGQSK
jgi:hypothetical protein